LLATTAKPLERRHRAGTVIGIALVTLAVFSLAVLLSTLEGAIEVRAPAGFVFLASVLALTLMAIGDLIAKGDRSGGP